MHSNLESRLLNLESKKDKKNIFVIYYKHGETLEEAVEKSGYDGPVITMPEPVSSIEEWLDSIPYQYKS